MSTAVPLATYDLASISKVSGQLVATFEKVAGQGDDELIVPAETQTTYLFDATYGLTLSETPLPEGAKPFRV
jgi:hypothetical protein